MLSEQRRRLGLGLIVCAGALLLGACTTGGDKNFAKVRSDPAPELLSLNDRPVDYSRKHKYAYDTNLRMMISDWQRGSLTDRPSRLTPEPMR